MAEGFHAPFWVDENLPPLTKPNTSHLHTPLSHFLDSSCSQRAKGLPALRQDSAGRPARGIMPRKSSVEEIKAFFSASPQILKIGLFVSRAMFNGFPPSSKCLRKHRRVSAQCQHRTGTTGINLTRGEPFTSSSDGSMFSEKSLECLR